MSGRFSRKLRRDLRVHPAKTRTLFLRRRSLMCMRRETRCRLNTSLVVKRRLDYPAHGKPETVASTEKEKERSGKENSRAFIVSGSLALVKKEPFSLMGLNRSTFRPRCSSLNSPLAPRRVVVEAGVGDNGRGGRWGDPVPGTNI